MSRQLRSGLRRYKQGVTTEKSRRRKTAAGGRRKRLKLLTNRSYLVSQAPGRVSGVSEGKEGPLTTSTLTRASVRRRPGPVSKVRPDAEETLRIVLARLDDMKAEDTLTIDLSSKSSIADFMVVSTGTSSRHVGSLADRVLKDLSDAGVPGVKAEGMPQCDWVLIDAGDVIVHVFRPEVRAFYNLEKMWASGSTGKRRAS